MKNPPEPTTQQITLPATLPDPQTPNQNLLTKIPHESVWLANFISDRSKKTYSSAVKDFIAFLQIKSPEKLRLIDQAHLIAWRDQLINNGASPKTIQNRMSAISSLFNHLCDKQVVKLNPVKGIRRPRANTDLVKAQIITPEQVRKILDAPDTATLKGLRDFTVLHILFYTGCRVSEVCSLKIKDFYEDAGYYVLDFIVKGGKRNRIAIHQELQNAIKKYLEESGHGADREAPLILRVKRKHLKTPLNTRHISRIFQDYSKQVNLPEGVTPHSARATFITQALERKCPIEAVQRSVGHSKIATTQMYDKRSMKFRESASLAVLY